MAACPVANSSARHVGGVGMRKTAIRSALQCAACAAANASLCVVSPPSKKTTRSFRHKHQLSSSKVHLRTSTYVIQRAFHH